MHEESFPNALYFTRHPNQIPSKMQWFGDIPLKVIAIYVVVLFWDRFRAGAVDIFNPWSPYSALMTIHVYCIDDFQNLATTISIWPSPSRNMET